MPRIATVNQPIDIVVTVDPQKWAVTYGEDASPHNIESYVLGCISASAAANECGLNVGLSVAVDPNTPDGVAHIRGVLAADRDTWVRTYGTRDTPLSIRRDMKSYALGCINNSPAVDECGLRITR